MHSTSLGYTFITEHISTGCSHSAHKTCAVKTFALIFCISLFGGGIYATLHQFTTLGIAHAHTTSINISISIYLEPSSVVMTQRHADQTGKQGPATWVLIDSSSGARLRSGRTFSFHAKVFSIVCRNVVVVPLPPFSEALWWWVTRPINTQSNLEYGTVWFTV